MEQKENEFFKMSVKEFKDIIDTNGACNTSMNKEWLDNQKKVEDVKNKIPMRWIAEPKEIAGFVRTVLVEFSDYTTGSIFNIDGGRSIN